MNQPTIMYGQPVADKMFENWHPDLNARLTIFTNQQDTSSATYVRNKKAKCDSVGLSCEVVEIAELQPKSFWELLEVTLKKGNCVVVQKPLPKQLKTLDYDIDKLLSQYPDQDVDAFNGDLFTDLQTPATPLGIMKMLDHYVGISNIDGMSAVVIGRSKIVGEPVARLLTRANCTVTVCHTHTRDLKFYTQHADLIVCAVGKPKFLTADMIGDNMPIVVDVGINRDEAGNLCGDVDFEQVSAKCSFISPVPKGVGVLTVASLIHKMGQETC